MKLKVQKQSIESILVNLQPFLEKKDASQITSHVLFEAQENICSIKATDLEIGLEIKTDNLSIEQNGSCTANGKKLLDIVRMLKDDEITLEFLDNTLIIKQKHSKFKLPTFDVTSFPTFPTTEDKPQISLDSLSLIQSFKKISPAIDTNNPKFELNGALLSIKNEYTDIVGTDTRRLAIATIENKSEKELSLIIPKKAIMEIQKLFLDKIDIFYDEVNLIIEDNNFYFYSRLINGKYPDYDRIVPKTTKQTLVLPRKDMIDTIRMITTISQDIKMTILPDVVIFNSLSSENVEAKTELEIETKFDEKFEINFNSRYLLDFITQIEKNEFELQFNEPNLPFIAKDDNFITIIMPIVM